MSSDQSLNIWRCQIKIAETLPAASESTRGQILAQLTAESRQWSFTSPTEHDAAADLRLEQLCREVGDGLPFSKSVAELNAAIRARNKQRREHYYPLLPPAGELEKELPEPRPVRSIPAPPARPAYVPIDIDDEHRKAIDKAITNGTRKVLPSKLRATSAGISDDVRQKVWATLLEQELLYVGGEPNTLVAYNWARRLSTDWLRTELKTMPVSQMDLTSTDGGENGETVEPTMPWDWVNLSQPAQLEGPVWTMLNIGEDLDRQTVLNELKTEKPEDYEFIVKYVEGNGTRYSLAERQRALNIRRWLGRRAPVRKINVSQNSDLTPLPANTSKPVDKGTVSPLPSMPGLGVLRFGRASTHQPCRPRR
jgi:hypothetical protein